MDVPEACRVGWLFEGGGAKGSFSFAVAEKLLQAGVPVDAVAGTSVGALNALLVATGQTEIGRKLWNELQQHHVLPFRLPGFLGKAGLLLAFPHMLLWFLAGRRAWPDPGPIRYWAEVGILFLLMSPVFVFLASAISSSPWWANILFSLFGLMTLGICIGAPNADYDPQDWSIVHSTMRVAGLLLLMLGTGGLAIQLIIAWWDGLSVLTTAASMPGAAAAATVLLIIAMALFGSGLTAASSKPLKDIIAPIVDIGLRIPVHVTVAEVVTILDPDYPESALMVTAPDEPAQYQQVSTRLYVPRYLHLNDLEPEAKTLALLASASLPFGIAPSTHINGVDYVDGGVADNTPIRPLVDVERCDLIIWIGLNPEVIPANNERQADHPDPQEHWRRCWRKEDVTAWASFHEVSDEPHAHAGSSAMAVPWRVAPELFPTVIKILPGQDLGHLLDFSLEALAKRTSLGQLRAEEFLSQNRQRLNALRESRRRIDHGARQE